MFDCPAYYKDETSKEAFLRMDLSIRCDSSEHQPIRATAWVFFAPWAVGVPLLYVALLYRSRHSIQSGTPDERAMAISFLWSEYKPAFYWWEPLDSARRLALSSFVLFVDSKYPLTRLLLGLLLSVLFLALLFTAQPYKGHAITTFACVSQLSIVLVFIASIVISLCTEDSECKARFGIDNKYEMSVIVLLIGIGMLVLTVILLPDGMGGLVEWERKYIGLGSCFLCQSFHLLLLRE